MQPHRERNRRQRLAGSLTRQSQACSLPMTLLFSVRGRVAMSGFSEGTNFQFNFLSVQFSGSRPSVWPDMKTARSLILSFAAGLVTTGGAQAADLPVKAKAVEYVKVCSLYGAGFYYIPGTDTCIKLGGYLRVETALGTNAIFDGRLIGVGGTNNRYTNYYTSRSRQENYIDTRTATEYGVVRTFGQGDFPFYWVQLADFLAEQGQPGDSSWAELREAQTMTMSKLKNTGTVTITGVAVTDPTAGHHIDAPAAIQPQRHRHRAVEEVAVVADQKDRAGVIRDHLLQEIEGLEIEVVAVQVRPLTQAGQRRSEHLVTLRAQSIGDGGQCRFVHRLGKCRMGKNRVNQTGEESFGMLYTAEIYQFENELHSEMECVRLFFLTW